MTAKKRGSDREQPESLESVEEMFDVVTSKLAELETQGKDLQDTVFRDIALIKEQLQSHVLGLEMQQQLAQIDSRIHDLTERLDEPKPSDQVSFLTEEQSRFLEAIPALEESKRKRYQFLFLLITAFMAYVAAPYQINSTPSNEQAFLYGLGGFSIAVIMIFHSLRLLLFLGRTLRRKAFLYSAIVTTRAWVLRNCPDFFIKTVFPSSARYDATVCADTDEEYPNPFVYNLSTTLIIAFVQLLLVLGGLYFLSIMMSAYAGDDFKSEPDSGGSLDLVQLDWMKRSFFAFYILILAWLQFITNECSHYQHRIWEARRIRPESPNPVFPRALIEKTLWNGIARYSGVAVGIFGIACLIGGLNDTIWLSRQESFLWSRILDPLNACIGLTIFLGSKVTYTYMQIREAGRARRTG